MRRRIIALVGPKQSGKTTLAKLLAERGWVRQPFAAPIKAMIATLLLVQNVDETIINRMLNGDLKEVNTDWLSGRTPRFAMQTLGTEWRDIIDKNLWVDIWQAIVCNKYKEKDIVVDDMRFLHEAERVRELRGKVVLINRLGLDYSDSHVSELEYSRITHDLEIENNQDPTYMLNQLAYLLDKEF